MKMQRVVDTEGISSDHLNTALYYMRENDLFGTPSDGREGDIEWDDEFADPSQVAAAIAYLDDQNRLGPRRARRTRRGCSPHRPARSRREQ